LDLVQAAKTSLVEEAYLFHNGKNEWTEVGSAEEQGKVHVGDVPENTPHNVTMYHTHPKGAYEEQVRVVKASGLPAARAQLMAQVGIPLPSDNDIFSVIVRSLKHQRKFPG